MPEYSPAPASLDHLNPIQRYMQKGQLDKQDYLALLILVVVYFTIRPYLQKGAKWLFGNDQIEEGEKAQAEYMKRRAAKIGANSIRTGKADADTAIEEIDSSQDAITTGRNADSNTITNRKTKSQTPGKRSVEDELLDWDDELERKPTEGDKSDVMQWLDKWDK